MKLTDHPTVKAYHEKKKHSKPELEILDADSLKQDALAAGADDAGVIELSRECVSEYREGLLQVMPEASSILVLALKVNRPPLRSMAHSVANHEFQQVWAKFKQVQTDLSRRLGAEGIHCVSMSIGFPMEMDRWPEKIWLTSEKEFAAEAGLGHMGYNRLLLHPRFGAAVVLGSVLLSHACDRYDRPLNFNPCIECGLCLKVCPTGAVKKTGDFNFISCYTHNYRERLGGFLNWVEQIAQSRSASDYRRKVSDRETYSMWQNLSIGAQTRCDRCLAICPAGEEGIGDFVEDKKRLNGYRKRFKDLPETIYAVKGSDAAQHVDKNFPAKTIKHVSNGIYPSSVKMFFDNLPRIFQANQSEGMDAVFHFSFTGNEEYNNTVIIKNKAISVKEGLQGSADLHVTADSETWVRFLAKEANLIYALLTRKIKIKGSPKLMKSFAGCFPS